ncbi:MAG: cystathionine beta-lyase [Chloroflexota bacterium]|nr:cystathionine beta-lyase [Chloroflexota bacterium]
MDTHDLSIETRLTHAGLNPWENEGIPNIPVYHASTILKKNNQDAKNSDNKAGSSGKYGYGRTGTPTSNALEEALAEIYGMDGGVITSSGLSALTTVILTFAKQNGHILVSDSVYSSGRRYLTETVPRFGVEVEFFNPRISGTDLAKLIKPNTTLIHLESPGSLTFELHDLPSLTSVARDFGVPTLLDNTWATALGLDCSEMGVDIVAEAITKYVGGHSDLMMGAIVANEPLFGQVQNEARQLGQCAGPDDIYLAMRGLHTLHLRLDRSMSSSIIVANWLKQQPEVLQVFHPALPDHPDHEIFKRDFKTGAGLFAFQLSAGESAGPDILIDNLKLFGKGASWGGFESLVQEAQVEAHRSLEYPSEGTLIRLAIGAEDPNDLVQDLADGFNEMRRETNLEVR